MKNIIVKKYQKFTPCCGDIINSDGVCDNCGLMLKIEWKFILQYKKTN